MSWLPLLLLPVFMDWNLGKRLNSLLQCCCWAFFRGSFSLHSSILLTTGIKQKRLTLTKFHSPIRCVCVCEILIITTHEQSDHDHDGEKRRKKKCIWFKKKIQYTDIGQKGHQIKLNPIKSSGSIYIRRVGNQLE